MDTLIFFDFLAGGPLTAPSGLAVVGLGAAVAAPVRVVHLGEHEGSAAVGRGRQYGALVRRLGMLVPRCLQRLPCRLAASLLVLVTSWYKLQATRSACIARVPEVAEQLGAQEWLNMAAAR